MIRRIAREIVLQSLFQIDFTKCEPAFALAAAVEFQTEGDEDKAVVDVHKEEELAKAKEYAEKLLDGIMNNLEAVDASIGQYAIDWTVERMPATDRNILRIATYEMLFADEKLVPGVAINEAVEIAKLYGTDESPRFINGILGKMVK